MTAAAYVDRARHWALMLENREKERSGLDSIEDARPIVSRKHGVPKGTLTSLRKNRLKGIAVHWYENLRRGVIRELEAELRHVEHEIQIAHQSGVDPASGEAHALLAEKEILREALGLGPDGGVR